MVCVDLSPADRCQHREEEAIREKLLKKDRADHLAPAIVTPCSEIGLERSHFLSIPLSLLDCARCGCKLRTALPGPADSSPGRTGPRQPSCSVSVIYEHCNLSFRRDGEIQRHSCSSRALRAL
ncbi:unnamed protein product [Leuciscus chuanchicus]